MPLILKVLRYKGQPVSDEIIAGFDESGSSIGRSPDNDFVLLDPEGFISRKHASIVFRNGCYFLSDTSLNGTYVINRNLRLLQDTVELCDGDLVRIGDYEITVSFGELEEPPPPPRYAPCIEEPSPPPRPIPYPEPGLLPELFDEVHLAISAPRFVKPDSGFVARFAAYVPECETEVRQRIETAKRGRSEFIPQPETCRWQLGAPIRVRVTGDYFTAVPAEHSFKWDGCWAIKSFQVRPKPEVPVGTAQLGFEVWVADFPEAWLWIELEISTEFKPSNELAETVGQPMRQAFASYASADLPDALARISAITAWDKGLDIFYSWLDLIEGEDWESRLKKELSLREVLLLFWSRNAKASKWVDWEWRTVLRMRGLKAIQPRPIEPPEIAAPPEELAPHMNFRDRYLIAREAALRIAELKAEAKRN
jgi:FHA domain/TIR domain